MISTDMIGCMHSASTMRTTDDHIPENRYDSLIKEFAEEQWLAWISTWALTNVIRVRI